MGIGKDATNAAVTAATRKAAPGLATAAVRQLVDRAISGVPGFPGAPEVARRHLTRTRSVEASVRAVVDQHIRLAGAQGFVTNLGGIALLAIGLPANLVGLVLLNLRMTLAIAHLRGWDLSSPSVRLACLLVVLGEDDVQSLVRSGKIPGPPQQVAALPEVSAALVSEVSTSVGAGMLGRVAGKKVALTATRRVPILGGGVSAVLDGLVTRQTGKYADRALGHPTVVEQA